MHAEGVERVVVAEAVLEQDRHVADHARGGADDDGRPRRDEARGRRDGDEPRDEARGDAERGGLAAVLPLDERASRARRRRRRGAWSRSASAASCPAASALPALKPNQPNQRRPAPVSVMVRLCGSVRARAGSRARLPITSAQTSAEMPGRQVHDRAAREVERAQLEEPARRRPRPSARPGRRRASTTARTKATYAQNFMRSAKAPEMSAGVMTANIIWKATKASVRDGAVHLARRAPCETDVSRAPPMSAAVRGAERERVAEERPLHAHDRDRRERVHERRQHVLPAHHAAVEQRQRRASSGGRARSETRSQAVSPVSIFGTGSFAYRQNVSQLFRPGFPSGSAVRTESGMLGPPEWTTASPRTWPRCGLTATPRPHRRARRCAG